MLRYCVILSWLYFPFLVNFFPHSWDWLGGSCLCVCVCAFSSHYLDKILSLKLVSRAMFKTLAFLWLLDIQERPLFDLIHHQSPCRQRQRHVTYHCDHTLQICLLSKSLWSQSECFSGACVSRSTLWSYFCAVVCSRFSFRFYWNPFQLVGLAFEVCSGSFLLPMCWFFTVSVLPPQTCWVGHATQTSLFGIVAFFGWDETSCLKSQLLSPQSLQRLIPRKGAWYHLHSEEWPLSQLENWMIRTIWVGIHMLSYGSLASLFHIILLRRLSRLVLHWKMIGN